MKKEYDLIVVGGGILGLACALAAVNKKKKVAVIERNAQCVSASVRNFGFVTVSGQQAGAHWQRAKRSSHIWADIAAEAGIKILQKGAHLSAQRPEAEEVLEAFLDTEMGEECQIISRKKIKKLSYLNSPRCVLYSPHELRIESKDAIGKLSRWLHKSHGVDFFYNTSVQQIDLPKVYTSQGKFKAKKVVVCPGHDLTSLYPEAIKKAKAQLCTLQMQRISPAIPFKMKSALMSDLSLARYAGFAQLEEGKKLAKLLDKEQPKYRAEGIHLIIVQSADGSLVVGDSHHYDEVEKPFGCEHIDGLIQQEMQRMINIPEFEVQQRWLGVYASAKKPVFSYKPEKNVCIGMVTGGTGASTSFAFAEELLESLD